MGDDAVDCNCSKETDEMSIVPEGVADSELADDERNARLRAAVDRWLDRHERLVKALDDPRNLYCWVAGRRVAGLECFDCEFETVSGDCHGVTVSFGGANEFVGDDAKAVDAVSALTLIGMLLERLKIRPMLLWT